MAMTHIVASLLYSSTLCSKNCLTFIQDKLGDVHQHNVMPVDQSLSLSISHLVEQGQLIAIHHHSNDQPTTYVVRIKPTTTTYV